MDIASLLNLAGAHVQAGRYSQAEQLYRQILAANPDEPNALYGLGFVALMAKAYDDAARLIGAAVRKLPRAGQWYLTLGDALRYAGKLKDAVSAYEKAAKLMPEDSMAHNNLGAAYQESGDFKRAVAAFHRAVRLAPRDPQYLANIGAALLKLERNDEAKEYLERALAIAPDWGPALLNLGNVFLATGDFQAAVPLFRRAVATLPDLQEPRDNLAVALARNGKREEALDTLVESLAHRPTHLTYKELVDCLIKLHRPTEAETRAREGLDRFPGQVQVHTALGEALSHEGRVEEAIACYREGQRLAQDDSLLAAGIAFLLNAIPTDPTAQRAAAEAAARALAAKPVRPGPLPPRHPEKRLRIGYVSPDFRRHSVAYFFQGLLAHHDRGQVEVVCYTSNVARDEMTDRIQALADKWVDISLLTDDEAAQRIQRDGIDILVDLAGYTTGNRLGVFARRPAPIQMTYLGYPNSTGLPAIHYRITDALADAEGLTDPWYTEKLLRLPRVFLAYTAPEDAPALEPPPVARGEPLTFGSFNAIHKLSETTLDLWAGVLQRVPGSRLLLKTAEFSDEGVKERYRRLLAARGIGPERLILLGYEKERSGHLATYHRVDIALDTFPYHGTTTTCEALYMGVPVVTLVGNTHASRVGLSLLSAVGLEYLAAATPEAYAEAAAHLAGNLGELSTLRQSLRQRMSASLLMDGPTLARAIEAAYRQAWRDACAR